MTHANSCIVADCSGHDQTDQVLMHGLQVVYGALVEIQHQLHILGHQLVDIRHHLDVPAREQAGLARLDQQILDADQQLQSAAAVGHIDPGRTRTTRGSTTVSGPVTVEQVSADFDQYKTDATAKIQAISDANATLQQELADALANQGGIPPAVQTALDTLDQTIRDADAALNPAPPPST